MERKGTASFGLDVGGAHELAVVLELLPVHGGEGLADQAAGLAAQGLDAGLHVGQLQAARELGAQALDGGRGVPAVT